MNPAKSLKVIGDGDSPQTVYSIVQIRSTSTWNKASPRGRRDDMLPDDGSSTVKKIAADLRPSADGFAVRTSLVAGGGYAAGSQRAYSLDSCAM